MRAVFPLFGLLLLLLHPSCSRAQVSMHQPDVEFELATESVELPMSRVDGRIILNALVNGKGPFPFIFDTGAQGSVMDLQFAKEQGLDTGMEIHVGSPGGGGRPGYLVQVQELSIGGLTLKNLPSVAFEGMPFPKSDESPRGVIGPYSLKGLLVTLDYPREMIIFRRGELGPPDEQEIFGWKGNTPLPETPVSVAGKTILVHLDSGSSGALSVPVDLVDELPLAGPLVDKGYAKTVDQVEPVRGATLAGDLRIGRYRLENPTVHFVDIAKKTGNVGAGILSQFAMTYDPANRRLRLDGPEDGRLAPVEDKKPRYGLQLTALESEPLEVNVVDAGSVAEKAGLKAGDRIMSMNGRPIGELAVDDRLVALKGSPLQVTVRRGDGTLDVSMTLEP